jgi:hypothetical protein
VRVIGEQVAVGGHCVAALGGAEHLQVFDGDRFLLGLRRKVYSSPVRKI